MCEPKWTRDGALFQRAKGGERSFRNVGLPGYTGTERLIDELFADANKWAEHKAFVEAVKKAIEAIQADRERRHAVTVSQWQQSLFDALALLPAPDPAKPAAWKTETCETCEFVNPLVPRSDCDLIDGGDCRWGPGRDCCLDSRGDYPDRIIWQPACAQWRRAAPTEKEKSNGE